MKGACLLKYGRRGKPKFCPFRLANVSLQITKRGHFVINGSPRVIVHQVVRAPGVYFQKFGKVKKDERNKARFYGDIIPRKGVWVRLQLSKTGQVEIKLKKSTKVQAEMVERCLAVIEKQEIGRAHV